MSFPFSLSPDLYRTVFKLKTGAPPLGGYTKFPENSFEEALDNALKETQEDTEPQLPLSLLMQKARKTLEIVGESPRVSETHRIGKPHLEEAEDQTLALPRGMRSTPKISRSTGSLRDISPI